MERRHFLAGSAAATLAAPAVRAASDPKLLKFIQQADIALFDPSFAPAALATPNQAYIVYDMLYGVDNAVRPRPEMAADHLIEDGVKVWKITLREGLRFHDGKKVLARCRYLAERWAGSNLFAISVFVQVDELSAISDERGCRRRIPQALHEHGLSDARLGDGGAAPLFAGTARQVWVEPERELCAGLLDDEPGSRGPAGRTCRVWRSCAAPGSARPIATNRSASAAKYSYRRFVTCRISRWARSSLPLPTAAT
jgi:hypothetical protein